MQRRNKVGGLIDRRFGEDDPNLSLEDKMIERYTREQQRNHKKSSMFDLEEDDEPMGGLTHMGRPLFDDDDDEAPPKDDFDEEDLGSGDESDSSRAERRMLKRQRLEEAAEDQQEEDGQPERKKTKKEIYEEIIAKSKAHKFVSSLVFTRPSPILTTHRNGKQQRTRTMSSGKNSTRRCPNCKRCFSRDSSRQRRMERTHGSLS
jgi:hypothetical protein